MFDLLDDYQKIKLIYYRWKGGENGVRNNKVLRLSEKVVQLLEGVNGLRI